MAVNTLKCNHLTPMCIKGLKCTTDYGSVIYYRTRAEVVWHGIQYQQLIRWFKTMLLLTFWEISLLHDLTGSLHITMYVHCVSKKVPTIKLSVTLSNLNQLSKFLHCWKAYEICYKTHMTLRRVFIHMGIVANFTRFPPVQIFWKSVKSWQSYGEFKGGNFVWDTV